MSIRASDLSDEIKEQLLRRLRQKLGDYEYNKIYDSIGEDGIIELFLKQTVNENSTASNKSNVASRIRSVFSWIIFICLPFFSIALVWFFLSIGFEHFSLWYGKLLVGIFFAPWLFVISGGTIFNTESIFWIILCIIMMLLCVILTFWGIIQGLIILFT